MRHCRCWFAVTFELPFVMLDAFDQLQPHELSQAHVLVITLLAEGYWECTAQTLCVVEVGLPVYPVAWCEN